ncbi:ArsR/SmtB family transcription factor [Leptolyngbya sp. AN02str]|uniref:ArsR/SmtB family transcription factor n=1 Tax=Leptolyngbya sp. AN02str TaxID=3423363 RepID=UPI003D31F819
MTYHSSLEASSILHPSGAAISTEQRARIFAALSDPTRLKIVELLADQGELSGSDIAKQVGISLALFCHHSRTLAEAGLVTIRKEGQTKFSSLNQTALTNCFDSLNLGDRQR